MLETVGYDLERQIVAIVAQKAEEMGISQTQLAKDAFGDAEGTRWRRIRNTSKGGKPQSLRLCEAIAVAAALGLGLDRIIVEAELNLKNQGG